MGSYASYVVTLMVLVSWLPLATSGNNLNNNFADCSTKLSVLERALFNTSENQLHLSGAFFPPRVPPSRHIRVIYTFQDEDGNRDDECTVEYIWAIGGSLLIQPPTIFMFTSLLFSTLNNMVQNTTLELPYQCRGLVEDTVNGTCTCNDNDNDPLDILTQQLKQYSKFNDPSQIIRDETSAIQAICTEELRRDYYTHPGVVTYLVATLIFPVMFMTLIAFLVRSTHVTISYRLSQPSNHPNLAGFILSGICIMLYVISMDSAALYYIDKHEYTGENVTDTFVIKVMLIATLTFNLAILIAYILLSSLYIVGWYIEEEENSCHMKSLVCILIPYFYVIYGSETRDLLQPKKDLLYWAIVGLMITPLFSVASHAGYIMIAWLTEPAKMTAIALAALGIFMFLFLTFRQCYSINKRPTTFEYFANSTVNKFNIDKHYKECTILVLIMVLLTLLLMFAPLSLVILYPLVIVLLHGINIIILWCFYCYDYCYKKQAEATDNHTDQSDSDTEDFSIKSFLLSLSWAGVILGCVGFIIAAFYQLPISTIQLPLYLENITQIVIVVISLLVTYKILTIGETDVQKFLKNFRKYFKHVIRDIPYTPDGDLEAAGAAAGELTAVVIDKLSTRCQTYLAQKTAVTVCEDKENHIPKKTIKSFSEIRGILEANTPVTISGEITLLPDLVDGQVNHQVNVTLFRKIKVTVLSETSIAINDPTSVTTSEDIVLTVKKGEKKLPKGTAITVPTSTSVTHKESNNQTATINTFPSNTTVITNNDAVGTVVVQCPASVCGKVAATKYTRVTISPAIEHTLDKATKVVYHGNELGELPEGTKLNVTKVFIDKNTEFYLTEASLPNITAIIPENTEVYILNSIDC